MQAFTEYTNKKHEELITEAEEDLRLGKLIRLRNIKRYLIGLRSKLQDRGLAPLTVRSRMSGIKNFQRSLKKNSKIPNKPL
jgi:hypothetical protein